MLLDIQRITINKCQLSVGPFRDLSVRRRKEGAVLLCFHVLRPGNKLFLEQEKLVLSSQCSAISTSMAGCTAQVWCTNQNLMYVEVSLQMPVPEHMLHSNNGMRVAYGSNSLPASAFAIAPTVGLRMSVITMTISN